MKVTIYFGQHEEGEVYKNVRQTNVHENVFTMTFDMKKNKQLHEINFNWSKILCIEKEFETDGQTS